jgi:hypothetical protein
MFLRSLSATVAVLALAACDNPFDNIPGQITTSFDGGKELVLVASYSVSAAATGIAAWADVPVGTAAIVEMTGPLHMHCDGTFEKVPPEFNDPGNRPALDVGEGTDGVQFHAPAGNYTVVVAIPSRRVSIKKSFSSGPSAIDPLTGVWDLPSGCVPVADTQRQLRDYTAKNVAAIAYWVGRMDASPRKTELMALDGKAAEAIQTADKTAAVGALVKIRASVDPAHGDTFDYRTYCESNASIALLTQPVPST